MEEWKKLYLPRNKTTRESEVPARSQLLLPLGVSSVRDGKKVTEEHAINPNSVNDYVNMAGSKRPERGIGFGCVQIVSETVGRSERLVTK